MQGRSGKSQRKETFAESAINSMKDFIESDSSELITARRVKLNLEPRQYTPGEVKWTRQRLRVSQAVFALLMGVSTKTVEAWENGTNRLPGPVCRLLEEINLNPKAFLLRHLANSATRNTGVRRLRETVR